jgi:hypothetical protein
LSHGARWGSSHHASGANEPCPVRPYFVIFVAARTANTSSAKGEMPHV